MWHILDARIRQAPARLQAKVDQRSRHNDEQKDEEKDEQKDEQVTNRNWLLSKRRQNNPTSLKLHGG